MATILSRALATVPGVALLFSGHLGLSLSFADLRLERETVTKIVRVGYPASIEQSSGALSYTAMTAIIAFIGPTAVAAFGICARLTSFVFLPAVGLGMGTETAVGQNLGAKQADRAKQAVFASAGIIAAVLVVVTAVVYLNAAAIVDVFITGAESASVVAIGADYLRVVGLTYALLGVFHVVQGAYRGSGSTRLAMIFGVVGLILLRVPPAYALVAWFDMGATGVWYGIAAANVLMVLLSGAYFLRGTWTGRVVDRGPPGQEVTAGDD